MNESFARVICLRSQEADLTVAPNNKLWILRSPIRSPGSRSLVCVKALSLWQTTPSVRSPLRLTTSSGSYTIPAADWSAVSLQTYLNSKLVDENVSLSFDPMQLTYLFQPRLTLLASGTSPEVYPLLGLQDTGEDLLGITSSSQPVCFGTYRAVNVYSNLHLMMNQDSSLLLSVSIDPSVEYGGLITYHDQGSLLRQLCADSTIQYINIILTDQDGRDIDCSLNWDITLVFFEIPDTNQAATPIQTLWSPTSNN